MKDTKVDNIRMCQSLHYDLKVMAAQSSCTPGELVAGLFGMAKLLPLYGLKATLEAKHGHKNEGSAP